jgi:YVTN family beta-propeller protein
MIRKKLHRLVIGTSILLWIAVFVVTAFPVSAQAATVTINSPVNGQLFSGNSFVISGTAVAHATVLISRNGQTIAYTRTNESGAWSISLTDLPDGNNTITAKVLANTGYGYFLGSADGTTFKLYRLDLSTNALADDDTYPLTVSHADLGYVPSPVGTVLMGAGDLNGGPLVRFDTASPADPVVTSNYPSSPGTNVGAFSADGTKYYSPNMNLGTVSVVNVSTNTVIKTIQLPDGIQPVTASRTPTGLIYVTGGADGGVPQLTVIDPASDTITKNIATACSSNATATTTTFSTDESYPFYFVYCFGDEHEILKYRSSDNSLVAHWPTSVIGPTAGTLNLDNSKLYVTMSALASAQSTTNQIHVIDTETGEDLKTINGTHGIIGFQSSPDFQHIYAATPDGDFSKTGFDVIDMFTDDITHIDIPNIVVPIVTAPTGNLQTANVNVSVVLGVKTTAAAGGSLADTGAVAVSTTLLLGLIIGSLSYTYYDYRKHKKPLVVVDPGAKHSYTYLHHLRTVTMPLLKYRLSLSIQRATDDDDLIRKF